MNIIWIMADSLRYDHVGANGNDWIKTPSLDKFAANSVVFDRAFQLSFPTLPTRTDMFTGRYTFPRRGWQSLEWSDVVASDLFKEAGLYPHMIFDTYHLKNFWHNFDRGFGGWQWIRGQEADFGLPPQEPGDVRIHPTRPDVRLDPMGSNIREFSTMRHRQFESEYISPRTYTAAERWLEYNHKKPFFLYIDSFDPHEPWDPPAYYVEMYDSAYEGPVISHPPHYGFTDEFSQEQIHKMRMLYAGEVTMVDRWMGRLLQKIEDLGLRENTMIVVMCDHGFLLGDNGRIGKSNRDFRWRHEASGGDDRYLHPWPFYRIVNQLNFMVHVPGAKPRRTDAIVQPCDMLPTALEFLGADIPDVVEGQSFLPVLKGESDKLRDFAITSIELFTDQTNHEGMSTVTDGRYQLHFTTRPGETELHDLESDGGEEENVLDQNRSLAEDMHNLFYETIKDKVNDPKKAELVKKLL